MVEIHASELTNGPASPPVLANDVSLALDLTRAVAAQMVCVGHVINLSGVGYTYIPQLGVTLFFLISGFVIAFTLTSKSEWDQSYSLLDFIIERAARIYTPYLPALILIALMDYTAGQYGLYEPANMDWRTFLANVAMLQNYAGFVPGYANFGSSSHLTSLAIEFHIYLLVGAAFFLWKNRNPLWSSGLLIAASAMPIAYFTAEGASDRALFALWLCGFAVWFLFLSYRKAQPAHGVIVVLAVALPIVWRVTTERGGEYQMGGYVYLAGAFLCATLVFKSTRILRRIGAPIRFFANYSYSLFLIHYVIARYALSAWGNQSATVVIATVIICNAAAIIFARLTEAHYRQVANSLKAAKTANQ